MSDGWPYSEMLDGYERAAEDEAATEEAEAQARADRLDDYTPAPALDWGSDGR